MVAVPLTALRTLVFGAALLAFAAETGARTLERAPLAADAPPWSALGRINVGGAAFCTGVLIGPRTVLTAGHCLYNFTTQRWWPLDDIHFVAGFLRGGWVAAAKARRVIRDTGLALRNKHPGIDQIGEDWAVIELDAAIGDKAGWFGVARGPSLTVGALILQAGYRRDRPYAPELSPPCRIVDVRARPTLILHDCIVPEGGSGSPLFVVDHGELRVAGIHSAEVERMRKGGREAPQSLAAVVPLDVFAARLPLTPAAPSRSGAAAARVLAHQIGEPPPDDGANLIGLMEQAYRERRR